MLHPRRWFRAQSCTLKERLVQDALGLRGKPLKDRQFVRTLHPADTLGNLDVYPRRDDIGIVKGAALQIDDPGQVAVIDVEQAAAAVGAKMPAAVLGRC